MAQSFDPAWVSDVMQVAVVAVAPVVLVWAASTAMLGLSRHVYVLATNRQIPSWLGKLGERGERRTLRSSRRHGDRDRARDPG